MHTKETCSVSNSAVLPAVWTGLPGIQMSSWSVLTSAPTQQLSTRVTFSSSFFTSPFSRSLSGTAIKSLWALAELKWMDVQVLWGNIFKVYRDLFTIPLIQINQVKITDQTAYCQLSGNPSIQKRQIKMVSSFVLCFLPGSRADIDAVVKDISI